MARVLVTLLGLCAAASVASPTYEMGGDLEKRQQTSDDLYIVFSGGSFETIPPPGGGATAVYMAGFSIFTGSGNEIYTAQSIDGYNPCISGSHITVAGACLGTDFTLQVACEPAFDGDPGACAAWANTISSNNLLDCNPSDDSAYNDFITSGVSGTCVANFAQANDCFTDNDLTITFSNDDSTVVPCSCNGC